ncbi:alpha/beta fold hydrolase [Mycobacterium sp. NPDC048908]|uniref:alpha/beta fold hydrolase n=1 Tax=Mycobacterium sp. NPDC048908 TaxID=3364292 RepID=UPI00371EFEDD
MTEWTTRQIVDTEVRTLLDTMRMGAETDFRDELPAFGVPTLVMHGDADASAPIEITGRRTAELLSDATLIELQGVGHGLYVTHAPQIADAIAKIVLS